METIQLNGEEVVKNQNDNDCPQVLVDVASLVYAIPCSCVLSLEQLSKVTPLPTSPAEVRGVVNFRGKIIELLDTRILFNSKSIVDEVREFSELMDCMKEAHLTWVHTLEDSILTDKEFTLTTDPHQCAFGKWYDNYKTNDSVLKFELAKFDNPHKAIHQLGIDAVEMQKKGNKEGASNLINSTKATGLQQMIGLFESIKEAYAKSRREILVVLGETEQNAISVSVDEIVAIEHIFEVDEDLINNAGANTDYITGVAKRKNGSVIYILNDKFLLKTYSRVDSFIHK